MVRIIEHDPDAMYVAISASRTTCDFCGAPINWATTWGRNKRIPLDIQLADDPGTSQFLIEPKGKELIAHYLDRFDQSVGKVGYRSHLSTCPDKHPGSKLDIYLAATISPERQARIEVMKARNYRLGEQRLHPRPAPGDEIYGEDV